MVNLYFGVRCPVCETVSVWVSLVNYYLRNRMILKIGEGEGEGE